MCGIAGCTDDPNGSAVRVMSATQRHRGPDDEGLHTDSRSGVSIGVRRLAILDVPGGHHRPNNEDGTIWVAFNGEIYNYPQSRKLMLASLYCFYTNCPSEVLVHLYEEFGD